MRVTMSARVDFSSYGFCNVVEGDQLPVMKSLSQFWCVAYLSAFWVAIVNSTLLCLFLVNIVFPL